MYNVAATRLTAKQLSPTVSARFAAIAARYAGRTAVKSTGMEWTYQELDQRSNAVAGRILECAVETSEPVALLMEHGAMLIASILGVLKAGRLYLALDPVNPPARLATMLEDARTTLLLTDKPNLPLAGSLAHDRIKVMEINNRLTDSPSPPIPADHPSENGAWLIYTSGTTGAPKGVWQNHRGVVHHAEVYGQIIGLTPEDRLSLLASCSVAASATAMFAALLHGATLCPFHVRSQGAERLADWIHKQKITIYHSVPAVFRHLMRSPNVNRRTDSLRIVRIGGESALRRDVEACQQHCPPDCVFMHSLSATETGPVTAMMIDRKTRLTDWRVPAGPAVPGAKVLLLDDDGRPVEVGNKGRIAVCSAHLAQGYWQKPDLTDQSFRNGFPDPQNRMFIMADLGRFLPDGSLEHLGRVDQVVKIRGQPVNLEEVEAALRATNLFDEVAAIAPTNASGEHQLIAYVVNRGSQPATLRECRRLLSQSLPEHMLPNGFVPLDCLPKTSGGKVDRPALSLLKRRDVVDHKAEKAPAWPGLRSRFGSSRRSPHDGIEKKLTRIWETALGVSAIQPHDDFFEVGGTSLQSAQVMAGIEETFNVALSPSVLAERCTIEELAPLLADHAVMPSAGPLIRLNNNSSGERPLFLIHNGQGNVTTYGQLVRRLPGRPIFGLQAVGLQGESWPMMSIPAMARRYLREVIVKDSTGPYLLAGTCMGGLVALEMAQQLVGLGRPVALVALLDSNHPGQPLGGIELAEDTVRDAFRIMRAFLLRATGQARHSRWLAAYRSFVVNMTARANRFYRPTLYPGTVTLITTTDTIYPGDDMRLMMHQHCREARVIKIPGQRAGLFVRPVVEELARQMQNILDAAQK